MLTFARATRPAPGSDGSLVQTWRGPGGDVYARAFVAGARKRIDYPAFGVFEFTDGAAPVDVWPAARLSYADAVAQFSRRMAPVVLQAIGFQALHASAARVGDGAVLFCGISGTGKSTLAYACARRGHPQFADDAVVFEVTSSGANAHPLPFDAQLRVESRNFFGASTASRPAPLATTAIRAIFVLNRAPVPSPIVGRLGADAFAAVLTHAHCFDESDRAATRALSEDYLSLVRHVPVFGLTFGADFRQLDGLIDAVERASGLERRPALAGSGWQG